MRLTSQFSPAPSSLFTTSAPPDCHWAVFATELVQRARTVAERVFALQGPASPAAREYQLRKLFEEIEARTVDPREDWEQALSIQQGQRAIDEQLIRHGEIALRQCVFVVYSWEQNLSPLVFLHGDWTSAITASLAPMVTALEHANRHLAMLETLKNLEGKHYGVRASKGGHARHARPSNKDTTLLLNTMVKGLLYNNPNWEKRDRTEVADKLAEHIFAANREYQLLDIFSLKDLQAELREIVHSLREKQQRVSERQSRRRGLAYSLRREFPRTEKNQRLEAEAALTQGRIEGVRTVLIEQLILRFGDLPEAVETFMSQLRDLEVLQQYLARLPEAQSLEDVVPHESPLKTHTAS
ncbi:hypothetical protein KGQ96_04535 [Halomonas coralii]|uniref:hypothetical protein n=1 Tax=Modicisalibacter sp. R2A 31.J TaxID=2831898 RepID=UPI001CC8F48E|nr:hypothetical protein [Modicisalibacter sp. R2A 31.J]MBZ9557329.1 hypothetical protein [Modicisalibacter sp. R2A 31.J]